MTQQKIVFLKASSNIHFTRY